MIYRVAGWNEHFETAKSRTYNQCTNVYVPNKQGIGYKRIIAEPDGPAVYGIFMMLVGVLSRQRRPRNGWLTDSGQCPEPSPVIQHRPVNTSRIPQETGVSLARIPEEIGVSSPRIPCGYLEEPGWNCQDLACILNRPLGEIERAIEVLSSPRVGWLEVYQTIDSIPPHLRRNPDECSATGPRILQETGASLARIPQETEVSSYNRGREVNIKTPVKSADAAFRGSESGEDLEVDDEADEAEVENKPTSTPPTKKEPKATKAAKAKKAVAVSDEGLGFAKWFATTLDETERPQASMYPKWAKCYDDLLRLDGRTKGEVVAVCKWARGHHFWRKNFLSPLKLRKLNDEGTPYFTVFTTNMKTDAAPQAKVAPARETTMHHSQHL